MNTLVIERQAVLHNFQLVKKRAQGAALIGDLSADAYGLGLLETARLLADEGVHRFVVANARDAERLRDGGFTEEHLMTLRAPADRGELELFVELGVVCAVGSYEAGVVLNAAAEGHSSVCDVQILVDGGQGRYGFKPEETDKIFSVYRDMHALRVVGMCTVFSNPAGKARRIREEYTAFIQVVNAVRDAGLDPGMLHAADGLCLARFDWSLLDGVRLGRELGGALALRRGEDFRRAAYIEASVGQVDWFPKGAWVGGRKLKKTRRVAVLPVGLSNGFGLAPQAPQKAVGYEKRRAPLLITLGRDKVPLLGAPGFLDCTVDVSDIECRVGDVAVLEADPAYVKGLRRAYR